MKCLSTKIYPYIEWWMNEFIITWKKIPEHAAFACAPPNRRHATEWIKIGRNQRHSVNNILGISNQKWTRPLSIKMIFYNKLESTSCMEYKKPTHTRNQYFAPREVEINEENEMCRVKERVMAVSFQHEECFCARVFCFFILFHYSIVAPFGLPSISSLAAILRWPNTQTKLATMNKAEEYNNKTAPITDT